MNGRRESRKNLNELTQRIQRLLKVESLMGAVVLLKSLSTSTASQVLDGLPEKDREKLFDVWLGSGEQLVSELPAPAKIKESTKENPLDAVRFFPDHFISEVTAMLWVICLISVLTIFAPAILEVKANPLNTPVGVRPEWYFLFLYALLHFVSPVAGALALAAGAVLLTLLPFLDKNPEVKLSKRKLAVSVCGLILVSIVILSGASVFID